MRQANTGQCGNAASRTGDLSRFANPRQLMAYLGLVPSEQSSGARVKHGGITKGRAAQADPRDRLEGAAQTVRAIASSRAALPSPGAKGTARRQGRAAATMVSDSPVGGRRIRTLGPRPR
jgi:transposase